jgi:hypothetical protein
MHMKERSSRQNTTPMAWLGTIGDERSLSGDYAVQPEVVAFG